MTMHPHADMSFVNGILHSDALNSGVLAGLCGPGTLGAIALAAFVTALIGGFGHCATMCGPFVLMQVTGDDRDRSGPVLRRLGGALLPGYQAGRYTTYMALGALAGGAGGGVIQVTGLRWLMALLLAVAALAMAGQAVKGWLPARWPARWRGLPAPAFAARLGPLLARLALKGQDGKGGVRGYRLGLVLGLLPCGFLYAALAAAAATGGAAGGALVMGAFVTGTLPALTLVSVAGFGLASRWRLWAGRIAPPIYLINALTLGSLAVRILR